ncbi:hypothetical protein BO223_05165 [Faecalibaculum rodentium]|uniref:Uncharacterized protein n=1 Tax=Faecalibaculum rodentium TaxID=1702221 RepID=A0A1Q9YKZ0_9FIRM|nr:hypothetical protein BO223_05165 [Faecalibaculum rodentium]
MNFCREFNVFPDSAIRHNGKKDFLLRTSFIGCISIVHSRFADSPSPQLLRSLPNPGSCAGGVLFSLSQ